MALLAPVGDLAVVEVVIADMIAVISSLSKVMSISSGI
jgi:hypothetical protein